VNATAGKGPLSLLHDAHTGELQYVVILVREPEIGRICTRDTDFSRFPFLEAIDPLRPCFPCAR
jgi:uncharacterized protein